MSVGMLTDGWVCSGGGLAGDVVEPLQGVLTAANVELCGVITTAEITACIESAEPQICGAIEVSSITGHISTIGTICGIISEC